MAGMLDFSTDFGKRLKKHLEQDEIIWFTSVSPKGAPSPNPVWFFWDGETILVFSQPDSFRVRNLKLNPQVALNFESTDPHGNEVMVIIGEASLKPANQVIPAGYWAKYEKLLPDLGMTVEGMIRDYSVEIRIKPTRARGD
jgi:PPOX class probable F420-dependent enzyme